MKKRVAMLSLFSVVVMLVAILPVDAAEYFDTFNSGDSASMEITFQLTENDVAPPITPSHPAEPSGTYTVIIPGTIDLKERRDFAIRASDISLSTGKEIVVSVDGARTFAPDGNFYIYNGGTEANRRMQCGILRGASEMTELEAELLNGPGDFVVAAFGNGDFISSRYGKIFVTASYSLQNVPGNYTGTIYFKISVEDK